MNAPRAFRTLVILFLPCGAYGCAPSAVGRAAVQPPDPAECARLAAEVEPSGRSHVEAFDSMFREVVRNPNRRSNAPDSLRLQRLPAPVNVSDFPFSPGIYHGCPVFAFTMMPITWNPGPPPGAGAP